MKTELAIRMELDYQKQLADRFRVTYPDVAMYHELNVRQLEWVLSDD